jgi:deoxyribodipyrimidine photo-lyase
VSAGVHVVWYKRDLRVADHAPLVRAAAQGKVLPLFIVEPAIIQAPDYAPAHWTFQRACLAELRDDLASLGQPLVVRVGEAVEVFRQLAAMLPIAAIHAHEETGNAISYARDRAVRRWAQAAGIPLIESPGNGVVRRLPDRDGWAAIWEQRMRQPLMPIPRALRPVPGIDPGPLPTASDLDLGPDAMTGAQAGGERLAHATLASFLSERGRDYRRAMASPALAEDACSRISPYLAWGSLSVRQVAQAARARAAALDDAIADGVADPDTSAWRQALVSFDARLHWRCHFIQKLEDAPHFEHTNQARVYDGLRDEVADPDRLAAWRDGRTGYPLVDACMRALATTGWVTFRMRAMLVSFAAFDLWLHWRDPALVLARLFLDYEPGIHYSQMQMQAGTTGINTLRIYNPIKQAQEQDPDGLFIRRWLPELAGVPLAYLAAPWTMPAALQRHVGCIVGHDYPAPIVDHAVAARAAQERMHAIRRRPDARAEADAIQRRHGSRRRPQPPHRVGPVASRRPPASADAPRQLGLLLPNEG